VLDFVSQHWPALTAVAIFAYIFSQRYLTPLRKIPGPFFASWTRLPRIFAVTIGKPHEWELKLHRKYGRIVRTGPDLVSVGDPAAINIIYNANDKFKKVSTQDVQSTRLDMDRSNRVRSPPSTARSWSTTRRACSRTRWSSRTRPSTRV